MSEIKFVKETYEKAYSLNHSIGPYFYVDYTDKDDFEKIRVDIKNIFNNNGNPTKGLIIADSPWHAALILGDINHHYFKLGERLLFRGQSNPDWEIISSINHEYLTEKDKSVEEVKRKAFSEILAGISLNACKSPFPESDVDFLMLNPECYIAAAQHYGIKTNLIDWTTDPNIAIHFASENSKTNLSSVYVLKMSDAMENNFQIIIPPPFVERIHVQRGFFIESSEYKNLKQICIIEIRFPTKFDVGKFKVFRKGLGEIEINPESELLNRVKHLSDGMAHDYFNNQLNVLPQDSIRLRRRYTEEVNFYLNNYIYPNYLDFWIQYLIKFEEILFWTCYSEFEGKTIFDKVAFAKIHNDNQELVISVMKLWKYYLGNKLTKDSQHTERIKFFVSESDKILTKQDYR